MQTEEWKGGKMEMMAAPLQQHHHHHQEKHHHHPEKPLLSPATPG